MCMSQIIHSACTIHLIYIKHKYVHVNENDVMYMRTNKICTIYSINEKEIKRLNFS